MRKSLLTLLKEEDRLVELCEIYKDNITQTNDILSEFELRLKNAESTEEKELRLLDFTEAKNPLQLSIEGYKDKLKKAEEELANIQNEIVAYLDAIRRER